MLKKSNKSDFDCIVIGSGPAGVSATFPLVESGLQVLMLDGTGEAELDRDSDSEAWRRMLGNELQALLPEDGLSPKLRTPAARRITDAFQHAHDIQGQGFVTVGSIARGGLSRIWGAFVSEFDASDIEGWPFSIEELRASYRCVINRIGVSGNETDEMAEFYGRSGTILPALPIGPAASYLLRRYRPGSEGPEFGLGVARNAILSVPYAGRNACDLRNDCLWGCDRGSIYDARSDLNRLKLARTFHLADDAHVVGLVRSSGKWQVLTRDGRRFSAPRVLLAAGIFGTAALVIPLLKNAPNELRLLNNPVLAMPLLARAFPRPRP